MNLQLTLARADAEVCDKLWRDHKDHCPVCTRAHRYRHWDELCTSGRLLWRDRKETAALLQKERRLDKLPAPSQAPLF